MTGSRLLGSLYEMNLTSHTTITLLLRGQHQVIGYVPLIFILYLSSHIIPQATAHLSKSDNIFDNMAALAAPESTELCDELDHYLSSDPEHVVDAVCWWHDHRVEYPCLSRMAIDYLVIPCK